MFLIAAHKAVMLGTMKQLPQASVMYTGTQRWSPNRRQAMHGSTYMGVVYEMCTSNFYMYIQHDVTLKWAYKIRKVNLSSVYMVITLCDHI